MLDKISYLGKRLIGFLTIAVAMNADAQTIQPSLKIGDQAPELKYSKWLKGTPVKSFTGDQLYIVEFWATWCGPCKTAMPHLTKLQKQYEGKATIIGVNVMEKVKDADNYEAALPSVINFVKNNDANMGYNVIVDNNEQFLNSKWLKPAGINGIPATFVIKNNKILWIGHPNELDALLPRIFDGNYDMEAYKATYYKQQANSTGAQITYFVQPILDKVAAKDYTGALEATNKTSQTVKMIELLLARIKFQMLLKTNEAEAIKQGELMIKGERTHVGVVAADIYGESNLKPETYMFGAKTGEGMLNDSYNVSNPLAFHAVATLYGKGNNLEKAILYQQKAIDLFKSVPADQRPATVSLEEMEKALSGYKQDFERRN